MNRGKAAGDDDITVDFLKERGDIALQKLASLSSECVRTPKVPVAWENAKVILINNKEHPEDLKNYKLISLLSVVYKPFTQVIVSRIGDRQPGFQITQRAGWA